jgi:hypothetical protein
VTTLLAHKSGEFIRNDLTLPVDSLDPQAIGTAITYARRYALQALLGIAPEEGDDDAQAASGGRSFQGSRDRESEVRSGRSGPVQMPQRAEVAAPPSPGAPPTSQASPTSHAVSGAVHAAAVDTRRPGPVPVAARPQAPALITIIAGPIERKTARQSLLARAVQRRRRGVHVLDDDARPPAGGPRAQHPLQQRHDVDERPVDLRRRAPSRRRRRRCAMTPPLGWPTPAALFKTILCDCLLTLHDRGAVNEDALLGVFKDLLDHKPLTVDHLSAAFGPEAIYEALRQAGFMPDSPNAARRSVCAKGSGCGFTSSATPARSTAPAR